MLQASCNLFKMETHCAVNDTAGDGIGDGVGSDLTCDIYLSTPLYKLKLGVAESSDGISYADFGGLPGSVLSRAMHVKQCIMNRNLTIKPVSKDSSINASGDSWKGGVSLGGIDNKKVL